MSICLQCTTTVCNIMHQNQKPLRLQYIIFDTHEQGILTQKYGLIAKLCMGSILPEARFTVCGIKEPDFYSKSL